MQNIVRVFIGYFFPGSLTQNDCRGSVYLDGWVTEPNRGRESQKQNNKE